MINKKKITLEDLATKADVKNMLDNALRGFLKKNDMSNAIDNAVGKLAIMIQKGFVELNGKIEGLRDEIKNVDRRDDVVDLQVRVSKLEKKVRN